MFSFQSNKTLSSTSDYRSEIPLMGHNSRAYDSASRWFAVWTRSRQEKVVAATLDSLGVHNYLPLKSELRKWSDRKQMVETPLFSGYLFVNINLLTNSRLQVLKVPGVGALVGNQMGPLPIPDRQIEDIRKVLTAGVECSVQPLLKEGDRVRVVHGALAGIEGTLIRNSSASRLLVSIEMIRQSLSVSILRSDVEPVGPESVPEMYSQQAASITNRS
jgi:transcription termination/antitermination protein NusG